MFLLLYFIFRSVAAYRTVIVAMRCVIVSINHYLSIYLSIYLVDVMHKCNIQIYKCKKIVRTVMYFTVDIYITVRCVVHTWSFIIACVCDVLTLDRFADSFRLHLSSSSFLLSKPSE